MNKKILVAMFLILFLVGCSVQQKADKKSIKEKNNFDSGDNSLGEEENSSDGTDNFSELGYSVPVFIVIHLESGNDPQTTLYQKKYWSALVDLVALADTYDVSLTLEFNPQWATYILEDSEKLTLVRSWEAKGHEIGVHHHGPHHGSWNGYTNEVEYIDNPQYIGAIDDMMELLNQLPISGKIVTGGISTDEDKDFDWPDGILYNIDGGMNGVDDLLSSPTQDTFAGNEVISLTHAQYATDGKIAVSLQDIDKALGRADDGEVLGIIFHEKNYAEHPEDIEELFQLFQENNVEVETVSEILV